MPADVRVPVRAALFLDGDVRDITADVLQTQPINITMGAQAEGGPPRPEECRLVLRNTSGDYSMRNPLGQWYGHLGRNSPFFLWIDLARDTAGETAVNGWGSTSEVDDLDRSLTSLPWTVVGTTSNYAKSAGTARHTLTAAGDVRLSYLADVVHRDVEVRCTVTVPTSNVTGGAIGGANIALHGVDSNNYYFLRLRYETDESITLDFWQQLAGVGSSITGGAGATTLAMTHSAAQALRVVFGIEGRTLRAKVWVDGDPEPYAWTRTFVDEDTAGARPAFTGTAGWVGIRSSLVSGNTNGPITISYTDIEVRHNRFAGEVSNWPAETDPSGRYSVVPVTVASVRRRKAQGQAPLDSALRRLLSGEATLSSYVPVAYWPLEDRARAVAEEVLAVHGDAQLLFVPPTAGTTVGRISWAADSDLVGSNPLPTLTGGGSLVGRSALPIGDDTASWCVLWFTNMNVLDGAFSLLSTITERIQLALILDPANATQLNVYLTTPTVNALIMTHNFADQEDVERWHMVRVDAAQSGTSVDFFMEVDGVVSDSHTEASLTIEGLVRVQFSSTTDSTGSTAIGHVAIYDELPSTSDVVEAMIGNTSETAGQRMQRLCREENIEFDWWGTFEVGTYPPTEGVAHTPPIGPQRPVHFLALLDDCQRLDMGLLHAQRGNVAFHYRTRASLYAQSPWATLDYSDHQLALLQGAPDDQLTRNRVRAERVDGGDAQYEREDGPLGSAPPEDGGVGLYDEGYRVNAQTDRQLPGIAAWKVALGTVDQDRYPNVQLRLHKLNEGTTAEKLLRRALLDLTAGDLLRVTNARSVHLYDDLDQIAIGYRETITAMTHELFPVLVPAEPYRVSELDAAVSRLDSDTTTLAEDLDTTETGVTVAIEAGSALWTTDAGDLPFDVITGGEVMTVTAVSGATSPQTFTVTRSANGVVKSHSTGQKISLAQPSYVGL